jgi:hypothetical protein
LREMLGRMSRLSRYLGLALAVLVMLLILGFGPVNREHCRLPTNGPGKSAIESRWATSWPPQTGRPDGCVRNGPGKEFATLIGLAAPIDDQVSHQSTTDGKRDL